MTTLPAIRYARLSTNDDDDDSYELNILTKSSTLLPNGMHTTNPPARVIENNSSACTTKKLVSLIMCLIVSITLVYYTSMVVRSLVGVSPVYATSWHVEREVAEAYAEMQYEANSFKKNLYATSYVSYERIVNGKHQRFSVDKRDVLVFVHVQKTAGTTLERFLTRHLDIEHPCVCVDARRCKCTRPQPGHRKPRHWLFSRFSTGWQCGLHADWTEMIAGQCVDNALDKRENARGVERRYYIMTMLRAPIERYISEYRHVERGATWAHSRHVCNGRSATPAELPLCYDPSEGVWTNVTIDAFVDCPHNLAHNRQTRMLADLSLVHCYDKTRMTEEARNAAILQSAKANLHRMAFFGLTERLVDTQRLFTYTFRMSFDGSLAKWNKSKSNDTIVSDDQMSRIRSRNALDLELYDYARSLFDERVKFLPTLDDDAQVTLDYYNEEDVDEDEYQ